VKSVDFYFDYLSPYAYLASVRVPEICMKHGARLRMRPVLFAGLLNHWGQLGPAEIPPKAVFAFRACLRYARREGISFRSPRFHPFNPLTALRATLAADTEGERDRAVHALFDLGWGQGGDPGSAGEIAAALDHAGLNGHALIDRAASPAIKEGLAQETAQAISRGVFGVPTMAVDNELLWGLDQLETLGLLLRGEDPLAGVDIADLGPLGAAATRQRPTRDS
jgi:2-hydroxychromene-2-carboxylate isomerase